MPDFRQQLFNLVKRSPNLTAREYKRKLVNSGLSWVGKSHVNLTFYKNLHLFTKDNSQPPHWHVNNIILPTKTNNFARTLPSPKHLASRLNLYRWQSDAIDAWRKQDCRGVVEAVTGAGKSLIGIQVARDHIQRGGSVLIVVPTIELLTQWEILARKFFPSIEVGICGNGSNATFKQCRVVISTINTARSRKFVPSAIGGLLIADECHRYGSSVNFLALNEIFTKRLGLTATFERNDSGIEKRLLPYFGGTCFRLSYREALAEKVISNFCVAFVGVSFGGEERSKYDELTLSMTKNKKRLIEELSITKEPFGEFMKEVSDLSRGMINHVALFDSQKDRYYQAIRMARSYLASFSKRRDLLAESSAKRNGLEKLFDVIKDADRTLIFTQTIKSAEETAKFLSSRGLNAIAIHGSMPMKYRKDALLKFSEGRWKVVIAPHILDEGIDIPEVDLGIIVAGSKTRREMIQRMGRILRLKGDGRLAKFALLFIEKTSEDPQYGAHETFIEDIKENAKSIKIFPSDSDRSNIYAFLTT